MYVFMTSWCVGRVLQGHFLFLQAQMHGNSKTFQQFAQNCGQRFFIYQTASYLKWLYYSDRHTAGLTFYNHILWSQILQRKIKLIIITISIAERHTQNVLRLHKPDVQKQWNSTPIFGKSMDLLFPMNTSLERRRSFCLNLSGVQTDTSAKHCWFGLIRKDMRPNTQCRYLASKTTLQAHINYFSQSRMRNTHTAGADPAKLQLFWSRGYMWHELNQHRLIYY